MTLHIPVNFGGLFTSTMTLHIPGTKNRRVSLLKSVHCVSVSLCHRPKTISLSCETFDSVSPDETVCLSDPTVTPWGKYLQNVLINTFLTLLHNECSYKTYQVTHTYGTLTCTIMYVTYRVIVVYIIRYPIEITFGLVFTRTSDHPFQG